MKYRIIISLLLIALMAYAAVILDNGQAADVAPGSAPTTANPTNFNL